MNRTQFTRKFKELLKTVNANLMQNAERIITSGAVDREKYGDDFILPKIVLCALLEGEASAWLPLHPEHRKQIKNLRHF